MLKVLHPASCPAERAYVLDVLLGEFLGVEYVAQAGTVGEWVISLRDDATGRSVFMPDVFFRGAAEAWLDPRSMPARPLATWDAGESTCGPLLLDARLPVVFGAPAGAGSYLQETGDGIRLGIDVPGSAFFFLARYEEAVETERDALDRFPHHAALAFRENFLHRPVIDEYVEVLWHALSTLWPALRRRHRQYSIHLTHDVDLPWVVARRPPPEILRSMGADVFLRRDAGLLLRRLGAATRRGSAAMDADPANTFDWIMSVSERLSTASEFNFICGHSGSGDGNYSLEDTWIRTLMVDIHRRGHRIGAHPSLGTYRDRRQLAMEFDTLRRTCETLHIDQDSWGGRQHCLRWQNPVTWRNWDAVGLDYDNSLTWADAVGFRCGVCRAYPAYDVEARTRLRLRERPLVLMEATLIANMKVGHGHALEWTRRLSDACRRYRGEFSLLWHNNVLAGRRERRLYLDMLSVIEAA